MFGLPFRRGKREDYQSLMLDVGEEVVRKEVERFRKAEEDASPVAKEVVRLLRDQPERWTEESYLVLSYSGGLRVTTGVCISYITTTTITVAKGARSTTLSGDDVSVIFGAQNKWRAWRNERDAKAILGELTQL